MPFVPSRASDWSPQRETHLASNVVKSYQQTSAATRHLGAQFYPTWQEDAHEIGSRAGHGVEHGAAMLAHLSPTTEADANRMMGYQTLSLGDKATAHIHAAADKAGVLARLPHPAKRTDEQHAIAEKLGSEIKEHRRAAGLTGTPLNLQESRAISKSLKVRDGEDNDPMGGLGELKKRDFGTAIATGGAAPRQVIDTHYHDAIVGRTDIPYATDRGMQSKGRYEGLSRVADRAYDYAKNRGILDEDHQKPNDFMAATWYNTQQRKADANPAARKARKATETKNQNFLHGSQSHLYDPAKFGQRPIGGGGVNLL